MRDRLIELIDQADEECKHTKDCKSCSGYGKGSQCMNYHIADHLLANGVIVPPCKVGQIVYVVRSQTSNGKNLYLTGERVDHYRVFGERTFMCFESTRLSVPDYLWKTTVFLTREEAEQKLKEGKG